MYQIAQILGQIYTKLQFFERIAPFWRKFWKILKSRPIKVPNLRTWRPKFATMFVAHPYNHFGTEYPPPGFFSGVQMCGRCK